MKYGKGLVRSFWLLIFLFLIVGAYTSIAYAHDMWLNMDHHYREVGAAAKIYLAFGHSYPFSDFGDPGKMKSYYYLDPRGMKHPIKAQKDIPGTKFRIDQKGTYLAAVEMDPIFKCVTPEGHKFKSKKEAVDCIKCTFNQKFAKTIFYGDKPDGDAYRKALGHSLEMIPQKDPGLIRPGDYLTIKALFQGKPLKSVYLYATYLGFSTEGVFAFTAKTNGQGIAKIKILKPGIWYIYLPHMTPHQEKEECDKDKYAAILTFEVR